MPLLRALVPILPVASIARAVAFYRLLGFATTLHTDADEYAFLTRDHLELHLRRAPDLLEGQNPAGIYVYLHPGTAAALETEFRTTGVPILSPLALPPLAHARVRPGRPRRQPPSLRRSCDNGAVKEIANRFHTHSDPNSPSIREVNAL